MPREVAYPSQAPFAKGGRALAAWRRKLEFLQEQAALAVASDQKFALEEQIREALGKIREFGGE